MHTPNPNKTLRLLFPQWQGGNNPPYYLGAKLLDWLASSRHASSIAAIRKAHRRHGGDGALYVILRKPG